MTADLGWRAVRGRLRSPAVGVPIGLLAGLVAAVALRQLLLDSAATHTAGSALVVAAGVGVLVATTIATLWYGLATTRDDR